MVGMTYLVIVAFVAILGSLAAALVFMMRGNGPHEAADDGSSGPSSRPMAKALAFRVGVSILLFLVGLFAYAMGWIHPTGVPM